MGTGDHYRELGLELELGLGLGLGWSSAVFQMFGDGEIRALNTVGAGKAGDKHAMAGTEAHHVKIGEIPDQPHGWPMRRGKFIT